MNVFGEEIIKWFLPYLLRPIMPINGWISIGQIDNKTAMSIWLTVNIYFFAIDCNVVQ